MPLTHQTQNYGVPSRIPVSGTSSPVSPPEFASKTESRNASLASYFPGPIEF